MVSVWESAAAVRRFVGDGRDGTTGAAGDRAVFYPEDDRYLVDRDEQVAHFDVVFAEGEGITGAAASAAPGAEGAP